MTKPPSISPESPPLETLGTIKFLGESYGASVLGTQLTAWLPKKSNPNLLIFAGIHGEEPEGTVLLSKALRMQMEQPQSCAIILAANPDGLVLGTRGNANGVDLNRNFPTTNWTTDRPKHKWHTEQPQRVELSSGTEPGSEPETKALIELIESLKPKQVVTLHGPYGCIDDPDGSPLATWLAEKSALPLVKDIGYPTPGSFGTWCLEKKLPVITYELPNQSTWELMNTHLNLLYAMLKHGQSCIKNKI